MHLAAQVEPIDSSQPARGTRLRWAQAAPRRRRPSSSTGERPSPVDDPPRPPVMGEGAEGASIHEMKAGLGW